MSNEKSEQLSVRDGAGYDKVFGSSDESEDFLRSSERETSTQSPDKDESYTGESEEVVNEGEDEVEEGERESESDGDEDEGDEESYEGVSGGPGDNRPFILLED